MWGNVKHFPNFLKRNFGRRKAEGLIVAISKNPVGVLRRSDTPES